MAKHCRLNRDTVYDGLRRLKEFNLIQGHKRPGSTTVYTLTSPSKWNTHPDRVSEKEGYPPDSDTPYRKEKDTQVSENRGYKAAGTHLVLSPDPKLWEELRIKAVDERLFLQEILVKTMKELNDWRRAHYGPGHGLGWIAGTHVEADGAHKHPHIHVVVLKRDEKGKEVDWSVSALKGREGRANEPDPMQKVKRLFEKNVEKSFERHVGKSIEASRGMDREVFVQPNRNIRLVRQLQIIASALSPGMAHHSRNDFADTIRMIRIMSERSIDLKQWAKENLPSMSSTRSPKAQQKHDIELEPGD